MTHLSYQEAYVLELIHQLKDETEVSAASSFLLGLYVCYFLDDLEAKGIDILKNGEKEIEEYFVQSGEKMFHTNLFYPVLKKLMDSNLVKVKGKRIFKHFLRVQFINQRDESKIVYKGDLTEFILHAFQKHKSLQKEQQLKQIIEVFNTQLLTFLHSFEKEGEKFEFRLFWPKSIAPEIYAMGDWFEDENYKKNRETDEYIIENEPTVIKLRGDQLHTKNCAYDFYGIGRFTKKQKMDIPLEKRSLLQKKAIEVTKKRYLYKRDDPVKIEFATLTVQDKKWRTICIESPSLSTVLALSLLINPDHSEKLNYTAFIKKFYSPL